VEALKYINCSDEDIMGKWVTGFHLRDKARAVLAMIERGEK
jgi:hypothetical protein